MAYSQVDPARLQGDALRRWYLRSAADIEQERQDRAAQHYDAFFRAAPSPQPTQGLVGGRATTPIGAHASEILGVAAGPNSSHGQRGVSGGSWLESRWDRNGYAENQGADGRDHTQFAANSWNCAGCHSGPAPTPPPSGSRPSPLPYATPWTPKSPPRKTSKPHPRQCAMQNMNDSRICSREPGDAWKSVCLQSASDREAHCIASDGEIGWPPLQTHDRR